MLVTLVLDCRVLNSLTLCVTANSCSLATLLLQPLSRIQSVPDTPATLLVIGAWCSSHHSVLRGAEVGKVHAHGRLNPWK